MPGRVLLSRVARRLGHELIPADRYDLVPSGYYSVVTKPGAVPDEVWTRRSPMRGIDFETGRQLAWAQEHLAGAVREWDDQRPGGWVTSNGYFESVDTEILFAVVRSRGPARVVELGSGFSSLVIGAACAANSADGIITDYVAYDPYPREVVAAGVPGMRHLDRTRAQDLPDEVFLQLTSGDVLFVDTSHTVGPGRDVNHIVLDVLPLLAPGVIVHFHDILLPGEYHQGWVENGWHWAEAYLVQAYLSGNQEYAVRWSSAGVWTDHLDALRALVPSLRDHRPSSLWIERVAAGSQAGPRRSQ